MNELFENLIMYIFKTIVVLCIISVLFIVVIITIKMFNSNNLFMIILIPPFWLLCNFCIASLIGLFKNT